jgi:Tfp pilus assembly protein PilF
VSQIQQNNGLYEDAIENLNKIEDHIGIDERLSFEKFQLFIDNENFKDAQKELEKLIEKFPENSDYYIFLGDFYVDQGQFRKAESWYNKSFEVDSANGKVHFSKANLYRKKGDSIRFKNELIEGFSSPKVDLELKLRRFMPFVSRATDVDNPLELDEIFDIFDILVDIHSYNPRIYGVYGNFLVSEGKEDKALDMFDDALEIDAMQPEIWQEYLFLLSRRDDVDLLYKKASEAVSFFPDEPLFRLFHGVSLLQKEQFESAAKVMESGLALVSDNINLKERFHSYLGDIYYTMGDVDKSFEHYEKALEIDENNIMVLNNYSYYLSVLGRDLDKAEQMSSRTIELEPGNATYLDTYAWVLFKKERFKEAKFIIERAIDNLEEPSGVVIEHYGDILYKIGDTEGAMEQWKRVLKLDDHSEFLKSKIEQGRYIDENN